MNRFFVYFFLLWTGCKCVAEDRSDYFPLHKGGYWIYQGRVTWTTSTTIHTNSLNWKSEVIDTVQRGHVFGALLLGFPSDLTWYDEKRTREISLVIRVGTDHYHLFSGAEAKAAWARLKRGADLVGIVSEHDLFLETPLTKGKVYGEFGPTAREDLCYCWHVEQESNFESKSVKHLPAGNRREFKVAYRTMPDHQIYKFVPQVGIVGFEYVHHGTEATVDLKLVEVGTTAKSTNR